MIELPKNYGTEIVRCEVGSTLHGTGLGVALEDHDEMGVYVEWPESTIGLSTKEHYVTRTAAKDARSQPGDTDLVVYSLRKWAKLALNGNPSVLLLLFAPADKVVLNSPLGEILRSRPQLFASKRAGKAFLGYMEQQRQRMTGQRGRAGRVRVMPDGGVDWKYAMHMLRLGYQGIEFMETGRLTLPVPGPLGDELRAVRQGLVPIDNVIKEAEALESSMKWWMTASKLPEQPDTAVVERMVVNFHLDVWADEGVY